MMDHDDVDRETAHKLLNALIRVSRSDWHGKPVRDLGYRRSEVMVMFFIKRAARSEELGPKISEISRQLHVTSPTVTQLVKTLEAKGWVERVPDPDDQRAVRIRLTDAGEDVVREASDRFSRVFGDLVAYLGREEAERLVESLSKVSRYFSERKEDPWMPEK